MDHEDELGTQISRRDFEIDSISEAVARFNVATPSWGGGAEEGPRGCIVA
jgi:L-rhamnose isomerase